MKLREKHCFAALVNTFDSDKIGFQLTFVNKLLVTWNSWNRGAMRDMLRDCLLF